MGENSGPRIDERALERLYLEYNRREFVFTDPVQFLWDYDDPRDHEIVGLISSSLAYGRVTQILKSIRSILEKMPRPSKYLSSATIGSLERAFAGFRHRFTTGKDLAAMLYGAKLATEKHGSLNDCFLDGLSDSAETILPALDSFVKELKAGVTTRSNYLLPPPSGGSATKRLNLFLRWMVREDEVDPGCWRDVPTSKLIIPLDTHMTRICKALGATKRKQADMKTAIEITDFFRDINPKDPVRFDFSLTRLGMLDGTDILCSLTRCGIVEAA
jgi:uncharacterized protein (TIGR02757 family)